MLSFINTVLTLVALAGIYHIRRTLMVTAAEVKAVTAQVQKIGTESSATLEKVTQLEEALANANGIPQEVQDAFAELKAQVKVVDDLVADASPETPTEDPAA